VAGATLYLARALEPRSCWGRSGKVGARGSSLCPSCTPPIPPPHPPTPQPQEFKKADRAWRVWAAHEYKARSEERKKEWEERQAARKAAEQAFRPNKYETEVRGGRMWL
jgi:hypothetical protein